MASHCIDMKIQSVICLPTSSFFVKPVPSLPSPIWSLRFSLTGLLSVPGVTKHFASSWTVASDDALSLQTSWGWCLLSSSGFSSTPQKALLWKLSSGYFSLKPPHSHSITPVYLLSLKPLPQSTVLCIFTHWLPYCPPQENVSFRGKGTLPILLMATFPVAVKCLIYR